MRIKFSFLLLFFIYSSAFAIPTSLDEIRTLYKQAAASEEACSKLINYCNEQSLCSGAILLGYKGCATMLKAKHLINPFSKWFTFSKNSY